MIGSGRLGNPIHTGRKTEEDDKKKEEQSKRARLREKTIVEIIDTEISYVDDLRFMIDIFMKPLIKQFNLTHKETLDIFSNIEALLSVNQNIALALSSQSRPKHEVPVGDIFFTRAPFLKLYTTYCHNHTNALDTLTKMEKKNKEFGTYLREITETTPACRGLFLKDFLIKPIQRITKYPLLFSSLLQHTPQESPEHKILLDSLRLFQQMVMDINESHNKSLKFQELIDVNERIVDYPGTLVDPQRKFIKEGKIYCLHGKKKELAFLRKNGAHERVILAFSDRILYCKRSGKGLPGMGRQTSSNSLSFRSELLFGTFHVTDIPTNHSDHDVGFLIEKDSDDKLEILFTDTVMEKEIWMALLATQNTESLDNGQIDSNQNLENKTVQLPKLDTNQILENKMINSQKTPSSPKVPTTKKKFEFSKPVSRSTTTAFLKDKDKDKEKEKEKEKEKDPENLDFPKISEIKQNFEITEEKEPENCEIPSEPNLDKVPPTEKCAELMLGVNDVEMGEQGRVTVEGVGGVGDAVDTFKEEMTEKEKSSKETSSNNRIDIWKQSQNKISSKTSSLNQDISHSPVKPTTSRPWISIVPARPPNSVTTPATTPVPPERPSPRLTRTLPTADVGSL